MDPKTLDAIRASIAHWKENEQVTDLDNAKLGSKHCALCQLFLAQYCKGCPVFERTGQDGCSNTPYHAAWAVSKPARNLEAFRKAAKAEREFLESLLPPNTP